MLFVERAQYDPENLCGTRWRETGNKQWDIHCGGAGLSSAPDRSVLSKIRERQARYPHTKSELEARHRELPPPFATPKRLSKCPLRQSNEVSSPESVREKHLIHLPIRAHQ